MKLSILISPDRIVDLKSRTKSDVLKEMFRVIERSPDILNRNAFEKSLIERENILTTGIGNEIAIPHVQTDVVKGMVIAIGRCQEGIDFDSLDGKPVKIVIMIASSNQQPRTDFLKVLAKIVKTFREESFRKKILKAKDPQEIIALLESS
ncbi:MAG: PTS sugar transporter subunit IIA [bacterium]